MGNGVFTKIDTARFLNLLHLEGHEHRKALCGQGTEGINLPHTKRHNRIQPVHLLEFQHAELTKMLSRRGKQRFRVVIKLFFGIRRMHKGNHGEHHSLIPRR